MIPLFCKGQMQAKTNYDVKSQNNDYLGGGVVNGRAQGRSWLQGYILQLKIH